MNNSLPKPSPLIKRKADVFRHQLIDIFYSILAVEHFDRIDRMSKQQNR